MISVDNFKAIVAELSPVPDASNRPATARRRKAEKVIFTQVLRTKRCWNRKEQIKVLSQLSEAGVCFQDKIPARKARTWFQEKISVRMARTWFQVKMQQESKK